MTITLYQISKLFIYASVFCVIVVIPTTFFPFIGGKYYVFRFLVELALIFLILWWAFEAPKGMLEAHLRQVFRRPLVIAVTVFVIAFLLSCLFADNPNGAFWSNYERGEGGFQMLHYYGLFLLIVILFVDEHDWRILFRCSLVAAAGMIIYGFFAASFVDGFVGPYLRGDGGNALQMIFSGSRFQGSLGNPAYVAPYLMFIMAWACWLWWEKGFQNRARNIAYSVLLLFYLTFFVLSETRGAFVGLVAAGFAFLAYLAYSNRRVRKVTMSALGVLAFLGILVYGVFSGRSNLESIPGGRLLTVSASALSAQTRTWSWGAAWKGFLERPIFGWGPENFSTVFDKYFDPRFFVPGQNTETWFDRAHSQIFDTLAENGAFGFLAYASIFAVIFYLIIKHAKHVFFSSAEAHAHPLHHHMLVALLLALPVGYLVQGLVIFDVLPIYINLFIFWAFLNYQFSPHHAQHE